MPPHRRPVEHALLGVDRHGDYPISQLREQRAEPEEKRFPARRALRADNQIAFFEKSADVGGVLVALSRERNGFDGGDELGELADAVGDAADLPPERDGRDDGIEHGAVVADEEHAGMPLLRRRRRGALDDELDAHNLVVVVNDALRQRNIEVDADESQSKPDGHPEERH